jgi:hypothetical protein
VLEIIAVVMLSQRLGRVAKEGGRSGAWGWLFALGWVLGETVAGIAGVLIAQEFFVAYLIALAGAVTGGVGAWLVVANLPPVGVASAGTMPPQVAGSTTPDVALPKPMRRAGHCIDCGEDVWLTPAGACPNGHGPQSISGVYNVVEG